LIESTILSGLVYNEEYARKVTPFLKDEYFDNNSQKILFKEILNYIEKYNGLPTKEALRIAIDEKDNLNEEQYKEVSNTISNLNYEDKTDLDWIVDKTEKFCQDKAIYNAVRESILVLDGQHKSLDKGSIPKMLSDALGVSFDNNVGHDYLDNYEERYDFYHAKEDRISFDLDLFNQITKGGLSRKSLSIALAGCVHPSTKVRIRVERLDEKEVPISDVKMLLDNGYEVEVDSPDGFVPVNFYVDKGEWDEYVLTTMDGTEVICNENHLFQTTKGWELAKDLDACVVLTENGWKAANVRKTGDKVPIVDINVDHENHRYYTNGVSSHNTGVGKTLFMTHCAAANLTSGLNVLYITMEMAEERIAERIDANLLDLTIDELKEVPKATYETRIGRVKSKTTGKLIVKEYPTASAGSAHFRHLLNELKLKKNFTPDVVYIDYLNICMSSRMKYGANVNSYTLIKAIAEELRGLAVEFNIPIMSATQTTRSGYGSSDLGLEDTSESFGLPATADFMFGLISTEELESLGQLMVKQLKNRWGDTNFLKRFVVGIDRSKMRLYDAEEDAQDLMDDTPMMDRGDVGERLTKERKDFGDSVDVLSFNKKEKGKRSFDGFK